MTYRTLQRQIGYFAVEEDYEVWELRLMFEKVSTANIVRAIEKYKRIYL